MGSLRTSLDLGELCLDLSAGYIRHGEELISVTPKAWGVLCCLAQRPGQLVTKQELLDSVWPGVSVTDGSLTKVINELRRVLKAGATGADLIQTVHRRGYRLVIPTNLARSAGDPVDGGPASHPYVRREAELKRLHEWFRLARQGQRQTVFVIGEAGIGKTALVDAFLASLASSGQRVWAASGQCIEQYGPREPFMPLLEALGRLCRQPGGEHWVDLLRRHAPIWLTEIPGLLTPSDREALQKSTPAVTPERMLRVMVEALEVMSQDAPVVLVLDDLHWGDFSTLDLMSALAQRREPACLMVIATYRPADAIVERHPVHEVKHNLELRDRCRVLAVELLNSADIQKYLDQRFTPDAFPSSLAKLLHRHSDGNPLFLTAAIQHLQSEELLIERDGRWHLAAPPESVILEVPDTLRQMIERRYHQLDPVERSVLDAASVAGQTIAVPVLAAALQDDAAKVDGICSWLARRGLFLRTLERITWPDGTIVPRYRFIHSLYERTLYAAVPVDRRRQWHQRIGERIAAGFAGGAAEVAAEVASHFESAGAHELCIPQLEQAASNASRRFADQEAIEYLQRALHHLSMLPASSERTQREITLLLTLGALQFTTLGYGSKVARDTYARMVSLCDENQTQPQILPALGGIALYHLNQAELVEAQQFGERMLTVAEGMPLPAEMMAYVRAPLVLALYYQGNLAAAVRSIEEGVALCDPTEFTHAPHVWSDHGVSMLSHISILRVLHGRIEDAVERSAQALARAAAIGRAGTIAHANCFAAVMNYFLGEWSKVVELGESALRVTEENGLRFWRAQALAILGGGMAQVGRVDEGIARLREGYSEMRAAGGIATGTYVHCMIAEACLRAGRLDDAERELFEGCALVERTGERFAEAELYRNRAEIRQRRAASERDAGAHGVAAAHEEDAIHWFERAIVVAKQQGAVWWELRATLGLARVWADHGRRREADARLRRMVASLPSQVPTKDLREAMELLAMLETGLAGED